MLYVQEIPLLYEVPYYYLLFFLVLGLSLDAGGLRQRFCWLFFVSVGRCFYAWSDCIGLFFVFFSLSDLRGAVYCVMMTVVVTMMITMTMMIVRGLVCKALCSRRGFIEVRI